MREWAKDVLAGLFVFGVVFGMAYLVVRAAAGEVDPDSTILISEPESEEHRS